MSIVLPSELQYRASLPSLPAGVQSNEMSLLPVNGSAFSCATAGQLVQWDLPMRGYLVPNSMYIKYKGQTVSAGVAKMRGTPVYTPIQKLETIFGSQVVESINNYGMVQNMITNCTLNVAQKFGLQSGYGYRVDSVAAQAPNFQTLDGRVCATGGETASFSAPLPCLLSNAEKLVPLGMMPLVRMQLTLDSVANIYTTAAFSPVVAAAAAAAGILQETVAAPATDLILTDFQLCYTMVDFGPETDAAVRSMGDKLYIKSQSFINAATTIPTGAVGTLEYIYSTRLASVKSVFMHNSAGLCNGNFEAFDVTGGGNYQFSIAGKYFPPKPIDAGGNKSGVLLELKKAMGSIYDTTNNFSIDTAEFNATAIVAGTNTTISSPAKFFVGCNTEILPSNNVLLSGVSTQNTPITARLNIAVAPLVNILASLIVCFDAIIEVIPSDKSAVVRQ